MSAPGATYFLEQAKRCRWLASQSDESLAQTLRAMAEDYEARALEETDPSPAPPMECRQEPSSKG